MQIIIITAITLVSIFAIVYLSINLKNKFGKAEFVDLYSYNDKLITVGKVYHTAEDGGFYHTRISVVDKKNGKVLLTTSISGEPDVISIENQNIWFVDKRIIAVDFNKNKTIFSSAKIYKQYPEFKNVEFRNAYFTVDKSKIVFSTDTGFKYYIDCKTFEIKLYDESIENTNIEQVNKEKNKKSKDFGFEKPKNAERFVLKYKKNIIENGNSFIFPEILYEKGSKSDFTNENYVIFIHFQKMDKSSDFILTKIDSYGKTHWNIHQKDLKIKTKEYHTTEVKKVIQFENNLILAFSTGKDKLFSINIPNGTLNWIDSF